MYGDRTSERCSCCFEEHSLQYHTANDVQNNINECTFDMANECNRTLTTMNRTTKSAFTDFCRSTSLHGWQHLSIADQNRGVTRGGGKYMWILIVAASIGVASFFLFTSVDDFTSKYVVTNIDTTTASLHVSRCPIPYIISIFPYLNSIKSFEFFIYDQQKLNYYFF